MSHRIDRPHALRAGLVLAFTLLVYATAIGMSRPLPTGDEPHYLLIAQSIVHDGDLSMQNNYEDPHQVAAAYPPGGPLDVPSHAARFTDGAQLAPIHNVALPLLLSVVPALGLDWLAARFLMGLLAAITMAATYLLVQRFFPDRDWLPLVSISVVAACAPLVFFAGQIYPEVPAALLLVLACLGLSASPFGRGAAGTAASAASLLPWLHVRYTPLTLCLLAAVLLRVRLDRRGSREQGQVLRVAAIPAVLSAASMTAWNLHLYGSLSPSAAYGTASGLDTSLKAEYLYRFSLGGLLDSRAGVLVLAPVLLVAIAGLAVTIRRWPLWGFIGVAAALAYYIPVSALAGSGGWCVPGRWLVVLSPLLAIPLCAALDIGARARVLVIPLMALTFCLSLVSVLHYAQLYPTGRNDSTIPIVSTVQRAFPLTNPSAADGFDLPASELGHMIGTTVGTTVVGGPGDGAGFVLYGPSAALPAGTYQAVFTLSASSGRVDRPIAVIQLVDGDDVVAERSIGLTAPQTVTIQGFLEGRGVQTRVLSYGTAELTVYSVRVSPAFDGSVPVADVTDSVPLAIAWVLMIAMLGALLVAWDRARETAAALRSIAEPIRPNQPDVPERRAPAMPNDELTPDADRRRSTHRDEVGRR